MIRPRGRVLSGILAIGAILVVTVIVLFVLNRALTDTERVEELAGSVQSVVAIVAILGGGAFAYYKLQIFRVFEPHLTISHEVSHRYIGDNYVHIAVTATLHNSSKVKMELRKGFFLLQQISPLSDEEIEPLYEQVFGDQDYEHIQWPTLEEVDREFGEGELIVEPGESHPETFEFILPRGYDSVMAYTYFYNPISQRPPGWAATKVYDMIET